VSGTHHLQTKFEKKEKVTILYGATAEILKI